MTFFNIEAQSGQLNTELTSKFRGYAKIALDHLYFDSDKEPNDAKICHLERVFKLVGCDRRNPRHFISGSISSAVLRASLLQSNLNMGDLQAREPPELRLPAAQQVHCFGGRHRVLALRKYSPSATWWPVKLFIDLSTDARRLLAEEFANEAKYSDGEIVANILRYPEHSVDANQWWARLDKSKPRILKKIIGHPTLAPVFTKVLEIPGLRPGLLLAPWHKILPCVEEVIHYLELIHQTWSHIMGSRDALRFVDKDAVVELESRAPGVSYCDERHAAAEIQKGDVFKAVMNEEKRNEILQNLRQIRYLIPSIHTLQQDFKYLRQCTLVMRKLMSNKSQIPGTVRFMALYCFRNEEGQLVSSEASFLPNLKLLYLHIMQDVCELSGLPPLRDTDDDNDHELLPYDTKAWHRLAVRAKELGFSSDEILRLRRLDPDREVAIKALYEARPREEFDYGPNFERIVNELVKNFQRVEPVVSRKAPAAFTSHTGERVARRCGRVYSSAYHNDRHSITLDAFTCKVDKSTDITSLFVRRSVFHAFWGWGDGENHPESDQGINDRDDVMYEAEDAGLETSQHRRELALVTESRYQEMQDATTSTTLKTRQGQLWESERPQRRGDSAATVRMSKKMERERQTVSFARDRVEKISRKRRRRRLQKRLGPLSYRGVPRRRKLRKRPNTRLIGQQIMNAGFATNPLTLYHSDNIVQNATTHRSQRMCILIRENGIWKEALSCARESICEAVQEVWDKAGPGVFLYNKYGRGITVADCPNCDEEFVCLSTNSSEGFPAEEIL